jgi:CheY-like chemotaxis protein
VPDAQQTRADAHRCAVLVVEDETEIQEVFRAVLEAEGYDVSVAGNGRQALRHLRCTATTCVIVLDLMLPVMDGHRFRSMQLRDRSLAWIPVIVVSGGVDAAREAREIGAQAFVRKPIDVDQLRETVRRVGCSRARPRSDQRETSRPASER